VMLAPKRKRFIVASRLLKVDLPKRKYGLQNRFSLAAVSSTTTKRHSIGFPRLATKIELPYTTLRCAINTGLALRKMSSKQYLCFVGQRSKVSQTRSTVGPPVWIVARV